MSCIAVIPARYQSSRYPGKPLALIAGKPMIVWVLQQAQQAGCFSHIIVATDHEDIFKTVHTAGGHAMMTAADHPSGSDRVWEVAQAYPDAQFIFNLQGDEPLMNPRYLEEAAHFLQRHHDTVDIVTLKAPYHNPATHTPDVTDPNVVKVVTTADHRALYFSRATIPHVRDAQAPLEQAHVMYRHIGLYGYTRSALARFVALPPSPLEQLEKLEQLRALEAGLNIYALTVPTAPIGIDTPDDKRAVEAQLLSNPSSQTGGL